MLSVANRRVECAITATLTLRRAEWDCHETAWLTRSLTFVLGSPVNGNALYGCMVSVANRRVQCVHHAVCNSVCVSPTIMSRASADGRATRSLDCGARCPRSLWEPARAACNTFLGLWRTLLLFAFAQGASAAGAIRSLDSCARCSPVRVRSGSECERRNIFLGLWRTLQYDIVLAQNTFLELENLANDRGESSENLTRI